MLYILFVTCAQVHSTCKGRGSFSSHLELTAKSLVAQSLVEETLSGTRLLWGDPPADGRLDKEREKQIEERINVDHTCKYINHTEQSKLELSESVGSEVAFLSVGGGNPMFSPSH